MHNTTSKLQYNAKHSRLYTGYLRSRYPISALNEFLLKISSTIFAVFGMNKLTHRVKLLLCTYLIIKYIVSTKYDEMNKMSMQSGGRAGESCGESSPLHPLAPPQWFSRIFWALTPRTLALKIKYCAKYYN